jgi:hypothetical protein
MHGSNQVKNRHFHGQVTGAHKVMVLQAAFLAKTDRTGIPASVAFDALFKFIEPSPQTFIFVESFDIVNIHVVVYPHFLFVGFRF